jgi:nicotinic acid mononucleotide adenylyltransferase
MTLDTWERADELRQRVRVAVMSRPGSPLHLPEGWRAVALESDELNVSSSGIRAALHEGRSVADEVPPEVMQHVVDRGLYA